MYTPIMAKFTRRSYHSVARKIRINVHFGWKMQEAAGKHRKTPKL